MVAVKAANAGYTPVCTTLNSYMRIVLQQQQQLIASNFKQRTNASKRQLISGSVAPLRWRTPKSVASASEIHTRPKTELLDQNNKPPPVLSVRDNISYATLDSTLADLATT